MCDARIINAVKTTMLSRRGFLRSATAGVAAAASVTATQIAQAAAHSGVEDLTHTLWPDFPTYEGAALFSMEQVNTIADDGFNLFALDLSEHVGTHVDAPLHFSDEGASVDDIPVDNLVAPLCVIDIAARAADDPDTEVTPDDIRRWRDTYGDIPDNACVAMFSGWGAKVATEGFRNFDGVAQHYPGFHVEAATMLMQESGATSLAVDTLSLDRGLSADFATHVAWLPTGRFGVEAVANLDQVPASGATIVIGAPKHRGGSGGPARVLALV